MIRLGIVGFGQQGKLYAGILTGASLPGMPPVPQPMDCKLTAVSARNPAARPLVEALPGVTYFQDWKELIASDICDAIIITVPHFSHHEIAIRALEAGKHVLCEKPMTIRASDAEAIMDAQKKSGSKLAMMLNQRANDLLQQVKAIIDSGELGAMRNCSYLTNNWWRPDSYYESNPWRGTWSGEGGGILVNQACHPLDIWLWLCGMPQAVYARCLEGAHRNIPVENDVVVLARYADGRQGVFTSCSHDLIGTDRLEISFEKGKIILEGNRKATVLRYAMPEGTFGQHYDFRTFQTVLMQAPETIYQTQVLTSQNTFCSDYVQMFQNFAGYILRDEAPIVPAQAGLMQVQLANAIQLSGWTGQEITLPCDSEIYNRYLDEKILSEGKTPTL